MKNLIVLAALITCTLTFGQERQHENKEHHKKGKMEQMKDLSPEQIATLKTKKLTLALDLSKNQQDKVHALQLENAKNRKEQKAKRKEQKDSKKPELTSEEKFNRQNKGLDKRIAAKNAMKSILTEDQFKKWEHMQRDASTRKRKQHKKDR
jgi:hypothetical protein